MHACMYEFVLILIILTWYATEKHDFEPEIRHLSFQILVAFFSVFYKPVISQG